MWASLTFRMALFSAAFAVRLQSSPPPRLKPLIHWTHTPCFLLHQLSQQTHEDSCFLLVFLSFSFLCFLYIEVGLTYDSSFRCPTYGFDNFYTLQNAHHRKYKPYLSPYDVATRRRTASLGLHFSSVTYVLYNRNSEPLNALPLFHLP